MTVLFAPTALLPAGWAKDVRVTVDATGTILIVETDAASMGAERLAGPVLPGMPNLHSHAFQRAMAGLTERASAKGDDFWSWRETLYRFLAVLEPEDVRAIAAQLYLEMVKTGYTAVGEFHYLHRDRGGEPYADHGIMSAALLDAAQEVGIGITLLPALYQANGFGGVAPNPGQRRFLGTVDGMLDLVAELARRHRANPQIRIGLALHSLRAVSPDALAACVAGARGLDGTVPIHIHVAEQTAEVDQCLAWSGERPVAWLLNHGDVDQSWCLVHATHMDQSEVAGLAATKAVAGLCPTTEANLGDGFFALLPFLAAGGHWGIGSDSHVCVSPVEELRWLEYGQRLQLRRRALATAGKPGSTGASLWGPAALGGGRALGRPIGGIAPGARADLLVLDPNASTLYGKSGDEVVDAVIFANTGQAVRDVMIGGHWRVRDRHHAAEERVGAAFRRTLDRILPAIDF